MSVYRIISAERASFPVSVMCQVLEVSRPGFHRWERRAPSDRALSDAWLTEKIVEIHERARGVYGSRRVQAELRLGQGIRVSRRRIQRLMRTAGISGLVKQGINNAEACRLVGVNRKTGNRWRCGRKVRSSAGTLVTYPPVRIIAMKPRSPRYLSEQERIKIADLVAAKVTVRGIAAGLGRAPSTISREIRCNSDPDGRYRPHHAEQSARLRACKPRKRRIASDVVLAEIVQGLLSKRWSPEQVARELRELFVDERARWLCKESIYQAIYDAAVAITRPARRRRRRRRLQGWQRRGRLTAMRMIDERPAEVTDRVQAGHWEGDLIMGAWNRAAIGTLVERTTRFLILLAFPEGVATTDGVRDASTRALGSLPASLRRTLTWDQGKELAMHQHITTQTGTGVFFCDAHSPWQRGSNENMNGLLRDYFPKGSDLGVHTLEDVVRIVAEVNDPPRKTLGWQRPVELFTAAKATA